MSSKRYPEEFKVEAVTQVTERGHNVAEVAARLGVTTHSLYAWLKKYGPRSIEYQTEKDQVAEIRRLKARRTSPSTTSEVRLHFPVQGSLSDTPAVSGSRGAPQRLLRLGQGTTLNQSEGRPAPSWPDVPPL